MKFLHTSLLIFGIALSVSTSSAQTRVCEGDTVVLVLNGYKQGSTSWQQSPNRTQWSQASGISYNDSLIITATTTLYYRAIVTDGSCSPFYSDTTLVIINPTPPIAKPASGVTQFGFTANWSRVVGATDYYIDVATDASFTSFVTGGKNIDMGNADTTYTIYDLSCHTPYYYRVRDVSDGCTKLSANSNTMTVTTDTCFLSVYCTYKSTCKGNITDSRDNRTYKTVQIGTQCWMAQNLNVGTMIEGFLPQTPGLDNRDTSIEKYCYGNLDANCNIYGGLYLWDEIMAYEDKSTIIAPGPRGICPTGWHLPTDNEWKCLEMTVGMGPVTGDNTGWRGSVGGALKDTTRWKSPNIGATNSSGFSALPGGIRIFPGEVTDVGFFGWWWTATTEGPLSYIWFRILDGSSTQVYHNNFDNSRHEFGMSVRCVKDN